MRLPVFLLLASIVPSGCMFAQTVQADSTAPDTLLRSAAASFYAGEYLRVVDLLQPSFRSPRTPEANYFLGASFAALNDPSNAVRYLRMAVDSSASDIAFRFQFARSLGALGAVQEAREQYSRILARDSLFLPAIFNLGTLCFDGHDYPAAAGLFIRAVRCNPRDYLSYYNLAASLVNMGKPDSAMPFLRASLALNLRYMPSLGLLGSLYYKRKEYEDAGRMYGMMAARDSTNADTWARWGNCMEKLRNERWALHCFLNAAKYDTANSTYYARAAQSYFELQSFDSAAAFYMRAASLDEENPVLFLNAGFAYARMDSLEAALDAFHRSYAASHTEKLGLLFSQIGGIYYKQKRFERARQSYLKAIEFDPGNVRAFFFLAYSQDEVRDFKGAASSYARFLKKGGGDPEQSDLVPYARKRLRELSLRK
ncbi:MAG TPA: tetratricopeptide repeat protein [Bacteroidota bacterium]|nr:tetratricopeptide repeat protein [Bacteroidota bacterium]